MPVRAVVSVFIAIIPMETVATIIAVPSNVAFTFDIDGGDMGRTTASAGSNEYQEEGNRMI